MSELRAMDYFAGADAVLGHISALVFRRVRCLNLFPTWTRNVLEIAARVSR